MTITAPPREPRPASDRAPDNPATPYRRLWAAVLMHAYNDWWHRCERAKGHAGTIAKIHAEALRYFRSRDGRTVVALAGITADPERLAAIAIDLTARRRTKLTEGEA